MNPALKPLLSKIIVSLLVGIRNGCLDSIDCTDMIILVFALFYSVDELRPAHVVALKVIVKLFVPACIRFRSN